jgi:hypothetical protein
MRHAYPHPLELELPIEAWKRVGRRASYLCCLQGRDGWGAACEESDPEDESQCDCDQPEERDSLP